MKFKLNNNTNKNIYNFQMSLARVQKKIKKKNSIQSIDECTWYCSRHSRVSFCPLTALSAPGRTLPSWSRSAGMDDRLSAAGSDLRWRRKQSALARRLREWSCWCRCTDWWRTLCGRSYGRSIEAFLILCPLLGRACCCCCCRLKLGFNTYFSVLF